MMNRLLVSIKLWVFLVVVVAAYSFLILGIGQGFFNKKADGQLIISSDGKVMGSMLLAQNWDGEGFFHTRPTDFKSSLDLKTDDNLFLAHPDITKKLIKAKKINYPSASGLDPEITLNDAYEQAPRIAKSHGVSLEKIRFLIDHNAQLPFLWFIGTDRVNVNQLNLALLKIES